MSDLDARLRWMAARKETDLVDLLSRSVPTEALVHALARKYGVADLVDVSWKAKTSTPERSTGPVVSPTGAHPRTPR